jgi:hypothetical protein
MAWVDFTSIGLWMGRLLWELGGEPLEGFSLVTVGAGLVVE